MEDWFIQLPPTSVIQSLTQAEITQPNPSQTKPQATQTHSTSEKNPTMSPGAVLLDLHGAKTPRRASSPVGKPAGSWACAVTLRASTPHCLKAQHSPLPSAAPCSVIFSLPRAEGSWDCSHCSLTLLVPGQVPVSSSGRGRSAQRAPS